MCLTFYSSYFHSHPASGVGLFIDSCTQSGGSVLFVDWSIPEIVPKDQDNLRNCYLDTLPFISWTSGIHISKLGSEHEWFVVLRTHVIILGENILFHYFLQIQGVELVSPCSRYHCVLVILTFSYYCNLRK